MNKINPFTISLETYDYYVNIILKNKNDPWAQRGFYAIKYIDAIHDDDEDKAKIYLERFYKYHNMI